MLTVERSIRLALIMVLIGAGGCGPQGARSVSAPSPSASCPITPGSWQSGADQAPPGTPAVVKLGPGMEVTRNAVTLAAAARGTPMRVTGVVYSRTCRLLAGVSIRAVQTNGDGEYGPVVGDQLGACCYLQGLALTDDAGRYELDTVKPGHYKGADPVPPAHIHISVSHVGSGHLETELQFAGDPGLLSGPPDPGVPVTPIRDADGSLRAVFDIVLAER